VDQRQIENLILDLLGEVVHRDPDELRTELEEIGAELPIDSMFTAEVLARVEQVCGVSLPTDAQHARALRSVTAFAAAILEQVERASGSGVQATGTTSA
jgi:acyl carrier protein